MKMMTNLKKVYERPSVEIIPYGDDVMDVAHGAVSGYWTGNDDEKPEKPGTEPPPGGWDDWTAKENPFGEEVGYESNWDVW